MTNATRSLLAYPYKLAIPETILLTLSVSSIYAALYAFASILCPYSVSS
jgi:hypothetical protein